MHEVRSRLQDVFRDVFGDDSLILSDEMTAADIEGWDSMMHVNLIIAIEKAFGVTFALAEIASTKGQGENIGALVNRLVAKTGGSQ